MGVLFLTLWSPKADNAFIYSNSTSCSEILSMQNKGVLIKIYTSDSLCSFWLSLICLFPSSLRLLMINCSHKSLPSLLESRQLTPCTQVLHSFSQTQFWFFFHYLSFYLLIFFYRVLLQFAKIIWNSHPDPKNMQHLWWCVLFHRRAGNLR